MSDPKVPRTPEGNALSEALQDTFVSRDAEMFERQLAQLWRSLRDRGFTVASFAVLNETGTEHWNVPCGHGMSAHNDDGCVDCECTTPGFRTNSMTPTPREVEIERIAEALYRAGVPVPRMRGSAEWYAEIAARLVDRGLRSQLYLDGIVEAVERLRGRWQSAGDGWHGIDLIDRAAVLRLLRDDK